jgi:hypothetical protein
VIGTGTTQSQEKLVEVAEEMKVEMSDLLLAVKDIKTIMNVLAVETATLKQIADDAQLLRGEMEAAKEAQVVSASKLTFLDQGR